MADLARFERALLELDRSTAGEMLASRNGVVTALRSVDELVVPALESIGAGWERGTVSLSQVYMAGRICEELLGSLPQPAGCLVSRAPKAAITVLEDHHMLGKRMVVSALRASGFSLIDYGTTTAGELADRVLGDGVEVLLVSTLMLNSALRVGELRARLAAARARVTVVVGGAPFRLDTNLWREVGADACGRTSTDAVKIMTAVAAGAR